MLSLMVTTVDDRTAGDDEVMRHAWASLVSRLARRRVGGRASLLPPACGPSPLLEPFPYPMFARVPVLHRGDCMQLAIHFPNFTLPGGPEVLAPTLAATAGAAEAAGCSTFTMMDHW